MLLLCSPTYPQTPPPLPSPPRSPLGQGCPNVSSLSLSGCKHVSDIGGSALAALVRLTSLDLTRRVPLPLRRRARPRGVRVSVPPSLPILLGPVSSPRLTPLPPVLIACSRFAPFAPPPTHPLRQLRPHDRRLPLAHRQGLPAPRVTGTLRVPRLHGQVSSGGGTAFLRVALFYYYHHRASPVLSWLNAPAPARALLFGFVV